MKRYITYILAIATILPVFTSCEDAEFLKEKPKEVLEESFLDSPEAVESQINSIYYQLQRGEGFGRYLSVLSESLSDYCYGRGNFATSYSTGLTSGARSFSRDAWAVLYRAIRFSNGLLTNIGDANLSPAEYKLYEGEIRYLRAFSYSYLARYYGAVPFFDEHNMADFYKPRTPEEVIWKFVLSEAEYAASVLPEKSREAGRPSKYSALMLKTEAALYLKDYSLAAAASGEIIKSGIYSLVEVSTPDDFDKLYGYKAVNTTEEIFYIKYNRDVGNSFEWMFLCNPNPVSATGALGIYTDSKNNNFIASWDKNDFRYQYTLYHSTNGTLKALTTTGLICIKYRDPETDLSHMATDWPVYRYADALLYYAEAVCRRDGKPNAEAVEMVNKIRRRAYGHPQDTPISTDYKLEQFPTQEAFIDLLLKEKGYEQCFEGKRYCDLKRQGKLAEYALNAGRVKSLDEVKDAAYWWPIPDDEFNYNPNLDASKDQNPGY